MKEWYVDYLVQMQLDENKDHEDLTAPLLVIASVSKSEFKFLKIYTAILMSLVYICKSKQEM